VSKSISFASRVLAMSAAAVVGAGFLISGIGKMLDVEAFAQLLGEYGVPSLSWLAPFIPPLEVLLGLLLILGVDNKRYTAIACVVLVVFTAGFANAYLGRGVTDCGCFGVFAGSLQGSLWLTPTTTFIRNGVLILLAVVAWWKSPDELLPLGVWQWRGIAVLSIVLFTIAGVSYRTPLIAEQRFVGEAFAQTPLANVLREAPQILTKQFVQQVAQPSDSSALYAVMVFGVECSHCWNATENVKALKASGVVKELIAIGGGDSTGLRRYTANFAPNFPIVLLPEERAAAFARRFPTVWLIRRGKVFMLFEQDIPSPVTLRDMLQ